MTNRPIKFRAWDGERMQEDFCLSATGEVFQFQATIPAKLVEREDWELMQFTGLTDKNGKEIYEGDIIVYRGERQKSATPKVVEWRDALTGIGFNVTNQTRLREGNGGHETQKNMRYEVIGNIYENPELLHHD